MDQKIKTKNHKKNYMKTAYEKYKNLPLWKVIEKELIELEENQDLNITTQPEIVIGSIVKAIKDSRLLKEDNK
jgi:hypothetical protein